MRFLMAAFTRRAVEGTIHRRPLLGLLWIGWAAGNEEAAVKLTLAGFVEAAGLLGGREGVAVELQLKL
jgi:hypothetical protein